MTLEEIISTVVWTAGSIIVSQGVTILLMWRLGLSPHKLAEEIEEVQNTAVGAWFFIISLAASLFIGLMASSGFTEDPSFIESTVWIIGGLLLAVAFTAVLFYLGHRFLAQKRGESVIAFIRREIIQEQNAALAFFMGGLLVAPFIAVAFQLI
jgi:hypothetical protein